MLKGPVNVNLILDDPVRSPSVRRWKEFYNPEAHDGHVFDFAGLQ